MVDATDWGASSMPSGKKQISYKTYLEYGLEDWAQILTDQYKKHKNMQKNWYDSPILTFNR
jgi:hypothetical protein